MEGNEGRRQWRAGLLLFVVRRTACLATGGRRSDARLCCLGSGTSRGVIPGSTAPRIKARHCHAKIGGAAEPCHVSGQRFWSPPRQTSAAPRARAIGVAKSVSFKNKTESVRFKISFEKVLKLKKITQEAPPNGSYVYKSVFLKRCKS